jgi:hypothetical protein
MAAADLNSVLWRERDLLDSLLYFLETEQLLLAAGRTRWLAQASAQVERTTAVLRETEIMRAVEADQVAAELGIGTDPSLSALADAAQEPWCTIFNDQREALLSLTEQVTHMASANRSMLADAQRATRAALLALESTAGGAPDVFRADTAASSLVNPSR